jgi:hypothetical protein
MNASATTVHAITGVEATTNAATALVPVFTIMRKTDGAFEYLKADATDRLMPDDVLTVRFETPAPTAAASAARQALN